MLADLDAAFNQGRHARIGLFAQLVDELIVVRAALERLWVPAVASRYRAEKVTAVDSVDLDRYQGKWYEIARYPNRFQKKCVGNTTATYRIKKEGVVEVINECLKQDGKINRAKGKAKIVCGCFGTKHKALTNCLICGRISCSKEGYDFCASCGWLVEVREG